MTTHEDDTSALAVDEVPDDIDESVESPSPAELNAETLSGLVSYTLDWSVQSLLERIGKTFDINPSFQRRDAWSNDRKSLYIESLLLGLPVPQIVLAEDPSAKGRFIVLDGKQRLVTMKQFASPDENFKSFKLKGLQFVSELNNMSYENLQESPIYSEYADGFLAQPIRTIVIRNWGSPAVLYNIFVRLNQGSLSLSPQELRQALYPNDFTRWINTRSAQSNLIHEARRIKAEDFRMRDAEMLLRFIAFKQSLEEYSGNLRQFLDAACGVGQTTLEGRGEWYLEKLASTCEQAIQRTFTIFRNNAFLRFEENIYNRRFNIAVFDVMTAVLSDPLLDDRLIEEHAAEIEDAYKDLCLNDSEFQSALKASTKTIKATASRILKFSERVEAITGKTLEVTSRAIALALKAN
ncbi:DUF262 domain-containing protein [Paenarthrobacter nitroguajacolicus]|uniref:DUF262 domain-containing protein n=1 Tax=Paenarthrobacter nitroguajacolicus TaxID=211146 RepID=UPI00248D011C|nr:DUF262 domain-containing protein [Paenarthrobacter nitroguajacolicus]MDI2036779.1 hypothetical protein [Paenarthrobacter nitroguajacolicus]